MAIVTLSRELGANGSAIAAAIGERLGCPVLGRAALEGELERQGVPRPAAERYDERRPGLWDRLSVQVDRYRHGLTVAMLEAARRSPCVIVGRGGQVVLSGLPGVLHLRIVAPLETRILRLLARSGGTAPQAKRSLTQSDRDRAGFLRFFFDADWADPALYDLVVNTDALGTGQVAALVADLAEGPVLAAQAVRTAALLEDRCLAERVRGALLYRTERPLYVLDVRAEGGVVTLTGAIPYRAHIAHCVELAKRVEGVREVVCQLRPGVPD